MANPLPNHDFQHQIEFSDFERLRPPLSDEILNIRCAFAVPRFLRSIWWNHSPRASRTSSMSRLRTHAA